MRIVRSLNSSFFMIVICLAQLSWAGGSRVGNGNSGGKSSSVLIEISNDVILESQAPFVTKKNFSEGVRLEGPLHIKMNKTIMGIQPVADYQVVDVLKLSSEFPDLINKSQVEVSNQLSNSLWTEVKINNPCAVVKKRSVKNKNVHVVMWGQDDGFVISSDNTPAAKETAQKLIDSANLETRGCSWK